MTLITMTFALLHLALGATSTSAAAALQVEEPAPPAPQSSGRDAAVETDIAVAPPGGFRLAPGSTLSVDPRLYRRDI